MTKRHYLELMGIHVWQKRQAVASAQKVTDEASTVSDQQQLEPVPAIKAGGAALLADVRESLAAPMPGQESTAPVKSAPVAATPEKSQPVEPTPEFFLALSHFANFSMANLYPADFAGIPGNHDRFLTTLYFALSGAKGKGDLTEFRWPMVKSSRIPQPITEAQKVLGRHLQQCRPHLLVFGHEAATLLGAPAAAEIYSNHTVRDRQLLVVEETEVYFREPGKRQKLWRHLADIRRQITVRKFGLDR